MTISVSTASPSRDTASCSEDRPTAHHGHATSETKSILIGCFIAFLMMIICCVTCCVAGSTRGQQPHTAYPDLQMLAGPVAEPFGPGGNGFYSGRISTLDHHGQSQFNCSPSVRHASAPSWLVRA